MNSIIYIKLNNFKKQTTKACSKGIDNLFYNNKEFEFIIAKLLRIIFVKLKCQPISQWAYQDIAYQLSRIQVTYNTNF